METLKAALQIIFDPWLLFLVIGFAVFGGYMRHQAEKRRIREYGLSKQPGAKRRRRK